jgi:HSP20 family protein
MFYPTLWRTTTPVWDDAFTMQREVGRLMDRYFGLANGQQALTVWTPVVEVRETDDAFRVAAELPGLAPADVNVTVENGVLTISGEKKEERQEGKEETSFHLYERRYGRFERAFALPRAVIADDVRAEFANGVLTVTVPKAAEAKPRRIPIHAEPSTVETGTRSQK